jgi:hypothetical protein
LLDSVSKNECDVKDMTNISDSPDYRRNDGAGANAQSNSRSKSRVPAWVKMLSVAVLLALLLVAAFHFKHVKHLLSLGGPSAVPDAVEQH